MKRKSSGLSAFFNPRVLAGFLLCVAALAIGVFGFRLTATPLATITVNTVADNDTAGDGLCTLREAIASANNAGNGDCGLNSSADDIITFSVSGTIILGSTLPNIVKGRGTLTIDGTGQSITISGNNSVRVMAVNSGANLTLQNLTIANGSATGSGGGVDSSGTLTIINSTFSGNSASGSGGGVINQFANSLTIINSTFSGNSARGSNGGGGAVDNRLQGQVTITNSTFSGNSVTVGGGGAADNRGGGQLTITNSTFSGNSAPSGSGGAVDNRSALTISDSTFSGNSSAITGGGVHSGFSSGKRTISNSTFSGNSAPEGGGVSVGGSGSALTISNSTFSGNSASESGGGAASRFNARLHIINSIFSSNSAVSGGGGVSNTSAGLTLQNTLVANSTSGGNCSGEITADNFNLADDNTCGSATQKTSAEIDLGTLGFNGGPTQTIPLHNGSAAINTGDNAVCNRQPVNNLDQRGVTRITATDRTCDVGAYEAQPCVAPPNDMLDWWPGDGTAEDIQGTHDGTLVGGTYGPGEVGQAFSLDGVDDYVDVGDVDLPVTFTIDAWLNTTNIDSGAIVAKDDLSSRSYSIVISAESHLYLTVFNTGQQVTEYFTTDPALAANLWQHVAVTYDGNAGAGQKVKFYINGAAVAANVNSDAGGTPANNSLAARIGLLGNGSFPYSGQIDEMEMFSRVLSATEIQALFAASAGGKCHPTPTPTPTPAPVTVTLTASPTDVTEGGKARYNIEASAAVAQDTTVNYAMSGNASLGSDYRVSAPPGQATILAGQTSVGVKLEAKKDSATEGTETAIMTLQAGSGYQIGNPNQATVSIADGP